MNKKILLLLAITFFVGVSSANAFEFKPYVGMDYIYSEIDMKHNVDNFLEDKFHSGSINIGAKLHKYFGVETFYQQSTERNKFVFDGLGNLAETKTKFNAYGADAFGYLPISCTGFDLVAGLGLAQYEAKVKLARDYFGSGKDRGLGYRFSAGVQYNITDHIAVRGLVRKVIIEEDVMDDIMEYSLGMRYTF